MMAVNLIRTNATHPDFMELVKHLDADLAIRDGDEHAFYAQFNKIDLIKNVVLAYADQIPLGCGAFKKHQDEVAEVKRMYVSPVGRRKGMAKKILAELELWAAEEGYKSCVLETGLKQPEAIALYKSCGYGHTPNYGQYKNLANSVCFEKTL